MQISLYLLCFLQFGSKVDTCGRFRSRPSAWSAASRLLSFSLFFYLWGSMRTLRSKLLLGNYFRRWVCLAGAKILAKMCILLIFSLTEVYFLGFSWSLKDRETKKKTITGSRRTKPTAEIWIDRNYPLLIKIAKSTVTISFFALFISPNCEKHSKYKLIYTF